MKFEPALEQGLLIKRYKRFLADVCAENGETFTLHCANTGKMTGCAEPGFSVYYSRSTTPKRKYACSWELSQNQHDHWIAVNTQLANKLAVEAIESGVIGELAGYDKLQTEVKYGDENSRIDILLSQSDDQGHGDENNAELCYIEVKSVTLLGENSGSDSGQGFFPDAVSTRGQKHLRELMAVKAAGHRAVLLFSVQHTGIAQVAPAAHIDAAYAELLQQAIAAGVEVICYGAAIDNTSISLTTPLPFSLTA